MFGLERSSAAGWSYLSRGCCSALHELQLLEFSNLFSVCHCLAGHFGDPLAEPHGSCEECSCYPHGTEQTEKGISICDSINGDCHCKPNVVGRICNECKNGYWNIVSGNGCESCNCDPIGSFNASCDIFTGECFCKPGVVGKKCDKCAAAHYGFSDEGCRACECDPSGSKGTQCDQYGQCPCNENVEGRRCDRCKENKYDRHQGCLDCPACYNLVQDAANEHREKLGRLARILNDIQSKPIVIDDSEFAGKLHAVQEKIDILLEDAKSGSGGGEKTLNEMLEDLEERLVEVQKLLDNADQSLEVTNRKIGQGGQNATLANGQIQAARRQLDDAVELLQTEGNTALGRAREISGHLGNQTNQISGISREARQYADRFKAEADANMKQAQEAQEKALEALKKANNAIAQQSNVTKELAATVATEIAQVRNKLSAVSKLTDQALTRAREVNDEALTLFAAVNRTTPPNIDINQLKKEAAAYNREADRLAEELNSKIDGNSKLLNNVVENIQLAEALLSR